MKTLKDIQHLEGVRVFLRTDFNVPIKNAIVVDSIRIRACLETIDYLRSRGAKVILASHLEVVDGEEPSLAPVAVSLKKLGVEAALIKDYKKAFEIIKAMPNGSCVLLENLRLWEGEKANDQKFAKELASLADIYVNDAFSVCHREHASIVSVPKYIPAYAGAHIEKEVVNLSKAFSPAHPFLFILGGAKFETKLPLLSKFMGIADRVFVGGALANDFYKARGYETGISRLSNLDFDLKTFMNDGKLVLPIDIENQNKEIKPANGLLKTDKILDAGPDTVKDLDREIKAAKFILWNGPLGLYEDGYRGPTLELAKFIGEATLRGATTIVGGGDTLAAIAALGIEEKFTFISTAGGAMLDFLAKGTLPGLESLK